LDPRNYITKLGKKGRIEKGIVGKIKTDKNEYKKKTQKKEKKHLTGYLKGL